MSKCEYHGKRTWTDGDCAFCFEPVDELLAYIESLTPKDIAKIIVEHAVKKLAKDETND